MINYQKTVFCEDCRFRFTGSEGQWWCKEVQLSYDGMSEADQLCQMYAELHFGNAVIHNRDNHCLLFAPTLRARISGFIGRILARR